MFSDTFLCLSTVDVRFEEFVKFLLTPQSEDTLGSGRFSLILYTHTLNVFTNCTGLFHTVCLFQIRCTFSGTITSRSGILCLKSIKHHPFLFHSCILHIASGLLVYTHTPYTNTHNLGFGVHSFSPKNNLSLLQDQVLASRFTGMALATLKLSTAGRSVELYTSTNALFTDKFTASVYKQYSIFVFSSVGSCTPLTRHPSSTPTTPLCPGSLCPTQTWSSTRGPWSAPYDLER